MKGTLKKQAVERSIQAASLLERLSEEKEDIAWTRFGHEWS